MAPGKRRVKSPVAVDLLLEIVARSEPATLVRCAAACKPLHRRILDPSFLRRVCTNEDDGGIIPPRFLVYLHKRSIRDLSHNRNLQPSVSLVHPATPAASSFTDGTLAPHMLRVALDDNRVGYDPLMSRGGLVVLRRPHGATIGTSVRRMDERCYDLCLFNPMTGHRTYLSCRSHWFRTYVLLTAADGIGCSFILLAVNVDRCNESGGFKITVQATKPGGTSWGPVTSDVQSLLPFRPLQHECEPVVLHGGIVHWLLSDGDQVLTYNIRTERLGTVDLPPTYYGGSHRILGTSPDGRLRLLSCERFMISVWVHLSDGWAKEAVIDVEHKVRSLLPPGPVSIEFKGSGERSDVVLLMAYANNRLFHRGLTIVLDLETTEMREINSSHSSLLLEVDLFMRLQSMKIY